MDEEYDDDFDDYTVIPSYLLDEKEERELSQNHHINFIGCPCCDVYDDEEYKRKIDYDRIYNCIIDGYKDKHHYFSIYDITLKKDNGMKYIPDRFLNKEKCLELVEKNANNIKNVPESLLTYEMCLKAIKCYNLFKYIPDEFIDKRLCMESVNEYGFTLKYVPEKYKSYDIYWAAVNKIPTELVNVKNITYEMCVHAIGKSKGCVDYVFSYIPEEFHTNEICDRAFKKKPPVIVKLPERYKTYDNYIKACYDELMHIHNVPMIYKTKELCYIHATHSLRINMNEVPHHIRDYDFYNYAIEYNRGFLFHLVPEKYITEELCYKAIEKKKVNNYERVMDKYVYRYTPIIKLMNKRNIKLKRKPFSICTSYIARKFAILMIIIKN